MPTRHPAGSVLKPAVEDQSVELGAARTPASETVLKEAVSILATGDSRSSEPWASTLWVFHRRHARNPHRERDFGLYRDRGTKYDNLDIETSGIKSAQPSGHVAIRVVPFE